MGGKLDTAESFDRIFGLYGHQFAVLIPLAAVIFIPIAVLSGLASRTGSVALGLVYVVLSLVGQALYTGAVVEAVNDMRDGRRDYSLPELLRAAAPYIWALIAAGVLVGLIVLLGLILLVIPGLVFLTWFALAAPAIVVERRGVFAAMTRSRELVSGNGWRVFGVIVVTFLVLLVVGTVFDRIATAASDNFGGHTFASLVGSVLTAPLLSLAVSVLYFQLRDIQQGTSGLAGPAPPPRV